MNNFEVPLIVYVAVGTAVCFCKLRDDGRKIYGLSPILTRYIGNENLRLAVEVLVFMLIGCLLSHGLVQPTTAPQAFAAGLAWTGLASGK
ncbi:hypothetical protein MicloDRAFT_00067430 [Microvirga lotononidis]|uniref:Uncharacterized protein n=1 Tax=Microvirga lotononidis TaxID=864069 RepID=I4YPX1_9HYPH|nr:hypothetical protein MicloDRAFT_00067430 [Microvirga lotononidis]